MLVLKRSLLAVFFLLSTSFVMNQLAAQQTITLNPTGLINVPAAGGTHTVTVTFGGGANAYLLSNVRSWMTVPRAATGGSISITIMPNTGAGRSTTLRFSPIGGGGASTSIFFTISQLGAGQRITLAPVSLTRVAATGATQSVAVTLAAGATGYTVEGAPTWAPVPATTTDGSVSIVVEANTGGPRSATVTLTPTGGSATAIPASFTISQLAASSASRIVNLNPSHLFVGATALTQSVAITYGGDATGYSVPASGTGAPPSWVTVPAMATGGNISVMIEANTGAARSTTITFTPTGGSGTAVNTPFTIHQRSGAAGAPRSVTITPSSLIDLPSTGAFRPITITLGGGATGYTLIDIAPSWVIFSDRRGSANVSMTVNRGAARSATLSFMPTGGSGTAVNTTLTVSQLSGLGNRTITLVPTQLIGIPQTGGTRMVSLTLGGDATGYSVSGAPPWVTVPATTTGGNISIRIEANTGGPRTARVTLTPTGGTGTAIPFTLTIGQVGGVVSRTLALVPASLSGIAAAGETRMVAVTYTGDRVTGYTFSGAPAWVTVSATATDGNISIMIEANTGAARNTTITFTPTGGMGVAGNTTFTLSQLASSANRTITLVPNPLVDVPAAGSTTRVMLTLGGDATGYNIPMAGGGSFPTWARSQPVAGMDNAIDIIVDANTGAARSVTVTFTPTGGTGDAFGTSFVIRQLAVANRTITLTPNTLVNVAGTGSTEMVGVMFGGGARGYSVAGTTSWVTVPAMATGGRMSIIIEPNPGGPRSATLTFTPTGGSTGTVVPTTFVIRQLTGIVNRTITLAPTSLSSIVTAGSTEMVSLTLGGDATGYSVPASGTGSVPSWVTGIPATGMAGTLSIVVEANPGAARMATITFTPTGGSAGRVVPTNFVISQAADLTARTVILDRTGLLALEPGGETRMVGVMFGGDATGYSVSGAPSWVTVSPMATDGNISIMVGPNPGILREVTITFTPTGGMTGRVVPTTFLIKQLEAISRTIRLTPTSLSSIPAAGSTTVVNVALGGGATGFSVPASGMTGAPPSWVTGIPTTSMASSLSIMVAENTGAAREATIVFTPTGGAIGAVVTTTFSINQVGTTGRTIRLTPTSLSSIAATGSTEMVSLALGGDATGYSVTGAPDWVTVPAMATDGSISIMIDANTGAARRVTLTFTPTGGMTGTVTPTTFLISQAGATDRTIRLTPDALPDLPAAGSTEMVMVALGGGATGYSVTGAPDWATVPAMATDGSISIMIDANTGAARRARMTFTPTGGMTGTVVPVTFAINQLSAVVAAAQTITLLPDALSGVAAEASTTPVMITYGGGADSYTVSGAPDWVTVPATATDGSISIRVDANTAGPRNTTLTFTPAGGDGTATPTTFAISQVAAGQRITLTPNTLPGIPAAGETRMLSVTFGGGATGFSVPASGMRQAPPDWVTVPETATEGSLSITIRPNTGEARMATIAFTPTGGSDLAIGTSLTISQLAAPPPADRTVTLTPDALSAVPAAGSTEVVALTLGGDATGYSVPASGTDAPPSWVTGISTTGMAGSLSIVVMPNTGAARMASVTFTPTGGAVGTVVPTTFVINQVGATDRTITLTPDGLPAVPSAGSTEVVMVGLGGDATGFSVPASGMLNAPPSWVTGIPTTGMGGSLSIVVMPNMGAARMASVTFTPTGGTGTAVPTTFVINQVASTDRTITLTPDALPAVPAAGSTEMVMVVLGGDATGFSVPAAEMPNAPPSWVTGIPTTGMGGSLSIMVAENMGAARRASVTFTPTGGTGTAVPTTFVINQAGATDRTITLTPTSLSDIAATGSTEVVMVVLGGDAAGFSVPAAGMPNGPPFWVTGIPTTGMGGSLSIVVMPNRGTARSATLTFTPTGGTGTAVPTTFAINQLAAGAAPQTITFDPTEFSSVAATAGMIEVGVMFGGGATGFTVPMTGPGAPPDWVTVPAMVDDMDDLNISVLANPTTSSRTAMIAFTPTGGMGTATPTTLNITQLGAAPPAQTIVLDPTSFDDVPAAGGMRTAGVTLGGGATGYTVPATGEGAAPSWVTGIPATGMAGMVTITLAANMTTSARSAMITFTPTGGAGVATPATLTVSQLGLVPTGPHVIISPSVLDNVPAAGDMRMVTVALGGSATGYTVPATGEGAPQSWVTGISSPGRVGDVTVTLVANTGPARSDTITFTSTGGMGTRTPATLTINQLGAAPGISVTSMPTNLTMLAAAGGTVTATITLSGGATGWSVMLPSPAFTTSSAATGTGDGTATLTYARNTTTSAREDTVMFVTVGGTGTAARDTLVLKQLARSAPPAMNFGSPEGVFADIRVVNPTSDELVVYGLSEAVGLRLRDLSGRQVFSAALAVGEQRVPLPALPRGVYILSFTNKEGEVANLRLLRK